MLTCMAPAKINLVLEVLGKRDDGYHEIRSLVQTIDLCDVLHFEPANELTFECTEASLQTSDNLVVQAAELLREISGYKKEAKIKLEKRIPWGVGLGGGSSDAAATLSALNRLWKLKLKVSTLMELAARLGSDVPFFMHGGVALIEGRGESVTPLAASMPSWFVLLLPPLPRILNKTKQLYSRLNARHFTAGQFVYRAFKIWSQDSQLSPSLLFNVFDKVAFGAFPGLEDYWSCFEEVGAKYIHVAGSGPALFTPVDSEAQAEKMRSLLIRQGIEAYSVSTVVPQVV
jgi:4-diphosphocytidyl-2-C-methyl-D-erythritol kinase